MSRLGIFLAVVAALAVTACVRPIPQRQAACCAVLGASRAQVESVLGAPSPPQSSKYHPFPSPPPDAPIYTTEHGYLTVTYGSIKKVASRFSLDLYEGKAPDAGFALARAYLPSDAVDSHAQAVGASANVRAFKSTTVAKDFPGSGGMVYLECTGPQPALMCEKVDVVVGRP